MFPLCKTICLFLHRISYGLGSYTQVAQSSHSQGDPWKLAQFWTKLNQAKDMQICRILQKFVSCNWGTCNKGSITHLLFHTFNQWKGRTA